MFEQVKEFLVEKVKCDPDKITLDTEIVNLGVDSLNFLMLIGDLEEKFGIEVTNEELLKIHTVKDLVDRLEK